MKNIALLILGMVLFAGCSQSDEAIKKKLISKKNQMAKIEKDIKELEAQLSDTTVNSNIIPVNVKDIVGETFNHYITAFGEVEAEKYAQISPEMGGHIKKIHINEGQYASKGTLLISLNTESIQNNINQVKTNLEFATKNFEKQERLWEENIGSEIQFLQAKTNKESLEAQLASLQAQKRMSQIIAPFNGYVDNIYLKEGELASPGMPIIEFVNLTNLSISADLSEEYMGSIKEGQKVQVTFDGMPDVVLTPKIQRISKVINKANRSFEIEVKIDNQDQKIKPFTVSTIKINDFSAENANIVPSIIVKQDIKGKYVYVAKEDEDEIIADKRYVEIGHSYNDKTMITKGLNKGDRVIIDGYNLVSTGIPVQVKKTL